MPTISYFYGIAIRIYFRDHPPPHFHAVYGGQEAIVDIQTLSVRSGRLPARATALVVEWARLHQDELMRAWDRASRMLLPGQIAPLD